MFRFTLLLAMIALAIPILAQSNQEIPESSPQQQNKVFIFTQTYCPACIRTKQYMLNQKIEYTELDIETDSKALEAFKRIKVRGVPLLIMNKKMNYGFDPEFITSHLYQ